MSTGNRLYYGVGMVPPGQRYWGVSLEAVQRLEPEGRLAYPCNELPRLKIISVAALFKGKRPDLPTAIDPYKAATARGGQQLSLM